MTDQITMFSHHQLAPSPLNPRGEPDPDGLKDLEASIAEMGLQQNLVARPLKPKKNGAGGAPCASHEVIAGGRRMKALGNLIKAGKLAKDTAIPVRVVACDDPEARLIAITENLQRENLNPMDQAEGLAQLEAEGLTTEDIARRLGKTRRFVQQRLALVNKLGAEAKTALRAGHINATQARALTSAPGKKSQAEAVKLIKDDDHFGTAEDLIEYLTRDNPPLDWAIFDRDLYKGEIITDPNDDEAGWFADTEQAGKLQTAAIDALLKSKGALVKEGKLTFAQAFRAGKGQYLYASDIRDARKGEKPGFAMAISLNLGVTTYENIVKREDEKPDAQPDAPGEADKPAIDPFTKGHLFHAHRRKSQALQMAVYLSPKAPLALACLALMGGHAACHIIRRATEKEDRALAPELAQILAGLGAHFKGHLDGEDGGNPLVMKSRYNWDGSGEDKTDHETPILVKLLLLNLDRLQEILAALVASSVGSFAGYQPGIGDNPTAAALAKALNLAGKEQKHGLEISGADDLDGIRAPILNGLARACGAEPHKTAGGTRRAILNRRTTLEGVVPNTVPPSMRFGTDEEIKALIEDAQKPGKEKTAAAKKAPPAPKKKAAAKTKPAAKPAAKKKKPAGRVVRRGIRK